MNDCRRTLRLGAVVAVIGLGLVLSLAGSFAAAEEKPPMSPRPNIVLILADDKYGEAGCKTLDVHGIAYFTAIPLRYKIAVDRGQSMVIQWN
jgi:hypothetical protein